MHYGCHRCDTTEFRVYCDLAELSGTCQCIIVVDMMHGSSSRAKPCTIPLGDPILITCEYALTWLEDVHTVGPTMNHIWVVWGHFNWDVYCSHPLNGMDGWKASNKRMRKTKNNTRSWAIFHKLSDPFLRFSSNLHISGKPDKILD